MNRHKDQRFDLDEPFYDCEKVSSATDCTGLIPSLPENHEQDIHYARLYAIHSSKPRKKRLRGM